MRIGKPKTPLTQKEYDQAIAKQRRLGLAGGLAIGGLFNLTGEGHNNGK